MAAKTSYSLVPSPVWKMALDYSDLETLSDLHKVSKGLSQIVNGYFQEQLKKQGHTFVLPPRKSSFGAFLITLKAGGPILVRTVRHGTFAQLLLMEPVAKRWPEIVTDIDQEGETGAHWAAKLGKVNCLNRILLWGHPLTRQNKAGDTFLHLAARAGLDAMVQHLIDIQMPLNTKNKAEQTPFDVAIDTSQVAVAVTLSDAGAKEADTDDFLALE